MIKRILIVIGILTLLGNLECLSQYQSHLIAYWSFDSKNADDFSGNKYHGTLMNDCSFIPGHNGKGFALHTIGNGTNETSGGHVLLPDLPFNTMKEFTISLWVKEYEISNFMGEAFIYFGSHSEGWIGILNSVKQPNYGDPTRYLHYSVGLVSDLKASDQLDYYFPKSVNNWNLYSIVYKSGHIKCYVNTNLVCEADQNVNYNFRKGALGRHWWSNGTITSTRLTADIDEVKIFDTALTDEEIGNEYQPSDTTFCHTTSFDYKEFADISKFKLAGNANQLSNLVELTDFTRSKSGAIWYGQKVPVMKGFSTEFSFILNNGTNNESEENSSPGADGFTLVIQNDKQSPIGEVGGSIGYAGISNGVAVEFDSFINEGHSDPKSDHVAVMVRDNNGIILSDHNGAYCLGTSTNNVPVIRALNDKYFCKVDYSVKLKQLSVYIDQTGIFNAPALVISNFDITKYINLSNGEFGFIGITSATGVAGERHMLTSWKACFVNTNTILSATEDENVNGESYISVAPNPSSESISISFNSVIGEKSNISIYDILGNISYSKDIIVQTGRMTEVVSTGGLPIGVYTCVVKTVRGIEISKIVLK